MGNSQTEREKNKYKSVVTSTDFESLTQRVTHNCTTVDQSLDQDNISKRVASLNSSTYTQMGPKATRNVKVWLPAEEFDF